VSEPATREEYEARYVANSRIEGYGFETRTVPACPFCGAPDWAVWPLADFAYSAMQTETTCSECGRSGRMLVERNDAGGVKAEFVQTGGPDPAPWLQPHPRRVPA